MRTANFEFSCDVYREGVCRNELTCKLPYKWVNSYFYYYPYGLRLQLGDAFLVSNCSFLFLTVYKCVNVMYGSFP